MGSAYNSIATSVLYRKGYFGETVSSPHHCFTNCCNHYPGYVDIMDKYESSSRLRSNQFPYHVTAASPSMSKNASVTASVQKRKDLRNYLDTPTNYMVVNFDERFVGSVQSDFLPTVKVDEQRTKELLGKIRGNSPEKPDKLLGRAPRLASSYLLPRKINSEADRIMFRRADAATQTEMNMNKMNFVGMTGYQSWTAEVVEPYLKVRAKPLVLSSHAHDLNNHFQHFY